MTIEFVIVAYETTCNGTAVAEPGFKGRTTEALGAFLQCLLPDASLQICLVLIVTLSIVCTLLQLMPNIG